MYDNPPPSQPPPTPLKPQSNLVRNLLICIGVLVLVIIILVMSNSGSGRSTSGYLVKTTTETATRTVAAPANTVTAMPEQPAGPKTMFDDGTYIVGTDILPGTYRAPGPAAGDSCYWERMGSLGGDDIIANERAPGQQLVTIAPTDAGFKTEECGTWQPVG